MTATNLAVVSSEASGGVLERIVATKRRDLTARISATPLAVLQAQATDSDRSFEAALAAEGFSLIAEIKHKSPSRGVIRADFDPATIAAIYDRHAAAISVLVDEPYFGGKLAYLGLARAASRLPLLAKDFFVEPYQVWEARVHGADAILLMASVLEVEAIAELHALAHTLGMAALVEVHDGDELEAVLSKTEARIVGVNSRNLKTLEIDERTIHALAPIARAAGKIVVAESGVHDAAAVERLRPIADAALVGTSLMRADDIEAKLGALGW